MPLNFNNPDKTPETLSTLRDALTGRLKRVKWEGRMERPSGVSGEITGGNLSLFFSLMGTPAEPRTRGKILFIEEVGEYYYHLDRMLISLKMAGKLKRLSALVVGGMNDMNDSRIPWGKSVEETILDVVREYDYPVLFNFPAGHLPDNHAFYIGSDARIEINGSKASLIFF
jgi:muramoyltetrapeptide carboxypeptidase